MCVVCVYVYVCLHAYVSTQYFTRVSLCLEAGPLNTCIICATCQSVSPSTLCLSEPWSLCLPSDVTLCRPVHLFTLPYIDGTTEIRSAANVWVIYVEQVSVEIVFLSSLFVTYALYGEGPNIHRRRLVINIEGAKIWVTNIGGQKFWGNLFSDKKS